MVTDELLGLYADVKIDRLHFLLWHFEKSKTSFCKCADYNSCTNASTSSETLVKIGAVTSEFKRAKIENVPRLGCNLKIIVHLACWRSETDWNSTILILAG